ncbi:hypothetical protein VNO78_08574 [Psophocarpus tetragonolobus]|uniref:Uncharacterized protein n=1 Tax=Psophocarpus tetragonolobus TaxID=3891 RepID=A0AAN9T5G5_PSOTE
MIQPQFGGEEKKSIERLRVRLAAVDLPRFLPPLPEQPELARGVLLSVSDVISSLFFNDLCLIGNNCCISALHRFKEGEEG